MSIRTATMSNSYSSQPRRPGFFRKLAVTLLFVVGIAGFMSLLNAYQKNLSSFWMTVFAILSIGFASGAGSRITFFQWSAFMRFFVVLLVLPLGLFLLGVFTNWHMGIGPLNPWAKGIIPEDELIQLVGAFLVAIISLEAWQKRGPKIQRSTESLSSSRGREQIPVTPVMQSVQPRQQAHSQENLNLQPKAPPRLKFMKAPKSRSRTRPRAAEKLFLSHTAQPAHSKRRRLFNRKPNLQISMYEEHRCPFCLEDVKHNDPRGVKKCEVCNTLHHADCWAITGFCQVPHLNT